MKTCKLSNLFGRFPLAPQTFSFPQDRVKAKPTSSFVDDMHIVNATSRADQLLSTTQATLDILYEAVSSLGMRLNPDKTVAVLCFRGKGAKAARLLAYSSDPPILTSPRWQISIRLVDVHKVLGVRVSRDGSMAPEIASRVSSARQALRPVRATIAPRQALKVQTKTIIAETLAASVLFSCCVYVGSSLCLS